ncbi:uncharacterized protein ACNLHF_018854 isoform 2-T2 [Anomaloglossus baeobatrachus]|uniref:uncharacterized protein LOC142309955 isoform X2 n=1 Tax=Anomaloglossus baeobatrachus TaxID=238106 RepID=UPI003F50606C
MWKLLLLLFAGAAFAQESGNYPEEIDDQFIKAASDEDDFFSEPYDQYNELDEEDLSLDEESHHIKPNFTEKAEDAACPNKATCSYHVFFRHRRFYRATRVCRNWRGDLSSIHSSRINSFLQRFVKGIVKNSSYVWIGIWKKKTSRACLAIRSRPNPEPRTQSICHPDSPYHLGSLR